MFHITTVDEREWAPFYLSHVSKSHISHFKYFKFFYLIFNFLKKRTHDSHLLFTFNQFII
jgi:hypothetical protein